MEAASSSGPGQKEASAQTAPIRIVKFELAAEAAEAGDGNKDESGEEVYKPPREDDLRVRRSYRACEAMHRGKDIQAAVLCGLLGY